MFQELLSEINGLTQQLTFHGYQSLVSHFLPQMILVVVVYITFLGWLVLQGSIAVSLAQASRQVIKISVLFLLATHWGVFSQYIYAVLTEGPNEVAETLYQGLNHGAIHGASSLQHGFDHIIQQGMRLGSRIWGLGGMTAYVLKFYGVIVWLVTLLLSASALLQLVAAKFSLAIMLLLAPIFLMFALWPQTSGLFQGWMRLSVAFSLVPIFVTGVLLLMISPMDGTLSHIQQSIERQGLTLTVILPYLLYNLVAVGLLFKANQLAFRVTDKWHSHRYGSQYNTRLMTDSLRHPEVKS